MTIIRSANYSDYSKKLDTCHFEGIRFIHLLLYFCRFYSNHYLNCYALNLQEIKHVAF